MRTRRGTIRFHHYWASNLGTQVELGNVDQYVLRFDPKSKKLNYLGAVVLAKEYQWHFIRVLVYVFLPLYGKARARFDGFNVVLTNRP
jgi:hypothetical protein